jgi:methyl-accepting chemotaxis protein
VGCSDAAGRIKLATDQMDPADRRTRPARRLCRQLEADQRQIADSTDEAKLLSARACEQLDTGAERVNAAVTEFRSVIDLVARLGQHVTNFAAVMEQVQQVSQSNRVDAKTTNMLALNAASKPSAPAMPGAHLRWSPPKSKSWRRTRAAPPTKSGAASAVWRPRRAGSLPKFSQGVEQSSRAEAQFETITDALHDATHLVALLDDQSDRIAQSLGHGACQWCEGA